MPKHNCNGVMFVRRCPGVGLREFTFDGVFGPKVSRAWPFTRGSQFYFSSDSGIGLQVETQDLYADTADAPVAAFLNGKSSLIMAYGATGSGKTHTLHGPSSSSSCTIQAPSTLSPDASTHTVHPLAGVAPRACAAALTALKRRCRIAKAKGLEPPQLFCSYVQVYGNEVTDLLEGGGQQAIGAWGGVAAAAIAQGAAEVTVADAAHMQQVPLSTMKSKPQPLYIHQLLLTAESNKRRAATAMNERSRSPHLPPPSRVCC